MDRLTAIRTFAAPGFSRARGRVRIMDSKWYVVRFQNVEHGQGDYVGLGEGEYSQLLPGRKAREARDARLNHCNGIAEHRGHVFELFASSYGGDLKSCGWHVSELEATRAALAKRFEHDKWIADCEKTLADYQAKQAIKPEEWRAGAIRDCERVIVEKREAFKCEVREVKP